MLPMMDPKSASEELPALYRALLDRVAQLEAAGERDFGYRIRKKATRIYSRAWDDRAGRELQELLHRTIDRAPVRRGQVQVSRRPSEPVI